MALYSMVSEKYLDGFYWSNRYIINAATLAAAVTHAGEIRTYEREVHFDTTLFSKYRVSDMVEGTDVYQVVNDGVYGSNIMGANQYLPLFCRVRVDFNTNGGGRPSRKYLCLPLPEADQSNGVLTSAKVAFIQSNYVTPLVTNVAFVDVDGQAFGSGSVYPRVAMHQMKRGSKRRSLPIIP